MASKRSFRTRSALIRTMEATRSEDIVDTKDIGQPFKLNGSRDKDEDFAEWKRKVKRFVLAKFGSGMLEPLRWAARQRLRILAVISTNSDRVTSYEARFGDEADEMDRVPGRNHFCTQPCTYLVAFLTRDREVLSARDGSGNAAWRRLHTAYDPASSLRRAAILGTLQDPNRCT